MSADSDLLAFVLRHGENVIRYLGDYGSSEADAAAKDLAWLVKVNRRNWSHEEHTEDCMGDDAVAAHRAIRMTPETVATNHRLHMARVERIAAAFRGER